MYGLISGQIKDKNWYTDTKPRRRISPYKQNERHLNSLKNEMETILGGTIPAYNLIINMNEDSYLNVCKFDKETNNLYQTVEELLFWILNNESASTPILYSQDQIIEVICKIHYDTLFRWEKRINSKLFTKYHQFLDIDDSNISPQPQLT